jgi:hypothetical protein
MNLTELNNLIKQETFLIPLPIKLTNGNVGRTTHFGASAKRRMEYEKLIKTLGLVKEPPFYRQSVVVARVLGKGEKYYDPDSLQRGNLKEIIDALVACGWFVDDSYKWIELVNCIQDGSDRSQGPAIRIYVTKV